ncbi:MAG: PRD domain-containing protein [Brooklawnia sp.]|uniref:BglG family transcription antiterminator n=1 Tax=Brooklawnia sp. TaxID=2699740 RepID=UPI003C791DAB
MFPLRAELAHLYPRELYWGEQIVAAVNAELDVELPPEEAIPIAMHLVNAAFNSGNLAFTYRMTGVFSQILEIIESEYGQPLDRDSVNVGRFITHLRYFFVRVHSDDQVDDDRGIFADAIRSAHPRAYGCAVKVRGLLEMRLEQPITEDETGYLALHIARLTRPERVRA